MAAQELWKYCTVEQVQEMLHSFRLLEGTSVRETSALKCLYAVSNHTSLHYHSVEIKKRGGGMRHLLVPDALLCTIQKNLLHHVLDGLQVSEYATAYKKQMSVVDNARPHVGQEQILKLDIKDFFGNITFFMVYQSAFPGIYFPPAVRKMLAELCCYEDYLPQGAPTSPMVSNLVMKSFDEYIGNWCASRQISYTRYCDDLTFSGVFDVRQLKNKVRNYLRTMGFELNERKTRLLKRHNRQTVTGIVVNESANVVREYRRQLRTEIYYCKKYGVEAHLKHTEKTKWMCEGEPDAARYLQHLLGKIQFILQVTPEDTAFNQAREDIGKMILFMEGDK